MDSIDKIELTDEDRQKIIDTIKEFISHELPEEPTEYDIFMKQKDDEFIQYIFEYYDTDMLLNLCSKEFADIFTLVVTYDMWLNESAVWPINYNPKWEEWEKLKEIKVKK